MARPTLVDINFIRHSGISHPLSEEYIIDSIIGDKSVQSGTSPTLKAGDQTDEATVAIFVADATYQVNVTREKLGAG